VIARVGKPATTRRVASARASSAGRIPRRSRRLRRRERGQPSSPAAVWGADVGSGASARRARVGAGHSGRDRRRLQSGIPRHAFDEVRLRIRRMEKSGDFAAQRYVCYTRLEAETLQSDSPSRMWLAFPSPPVRSRRDP
jgi:hypothetical protein